MPKPEKRAKLIFFMYIPTYYKLDKTIILVQVKIIFILSRYYLYSFRKENQWNT